MDKPSCSVPSHHVIREGTAAHSHTKLTSTATPCCVPQGPTGSRKQKKHDPTSYLQLCEPDNRNSAGPWLANLLGTATHTGCCGSMELQDQDSHDAQQRISSCYRGSPACCTAHARGTLCTPAKQHEEAACCAASDCLCANSTKRPQQAQACCKGLSLHERSPTGAGVLPCPSSMTW
jgi:hypothetical protein